MNKFIIPAIIIVVLLILYFNCGSSYSSSDDAQIVIINYDVHKYDKVTQKNIHEVFYNLVFMKQIMDSGSEQMKASLIPPIINSLSILVKNIESILNIETELTATVKGNNFKIKKDGVGNVCFGSPDYFLCLNPEKKDIFPYINDKLVVYHIMRGRVANIKYRDEDVERIVKKIIGNVIPCGDSVDLTAIDFDSLLLTKLFNSNLDPKIMSKLMMIILFMGSSSIIDSLTMNNDGSFSTSNATRDFLQSFVPYEIYTDLSYKQMKHALYNLCFAKYTVKGFAAVTSDTAKVEERKVLIESTVNKSLCPETASASPSA